jgi:hypothetical protein
MHYDSPHNTRKRTADVDLSERGTRIQIPPVAQVRLPVPVSLAGYDLVDIQRRSHFACLPAYGWRSHR